MLTLDFKKYLLYPTVQRMFDRVRQAARRKKGVNYICADERGAKNKYTIIVNIKLLLYLCAQKSKKISNLNIK